MAGRRDKGGPIGMAVGAIAVALLVAFFTHTVRFALLCLLVNMLACVPSTLLQTEVFYDGTGSLTFLIAMAMSHAQRVVPPTGASTGGGGVAEWRQWCATGMVVAWTLRLGSFLVWRMCKEGEDSRFRRARKQPALLFFFWVMQGVWVFLCALPVFVLHATPTAPDHVTPWDVLGGAIFLVGMVIEAVADAQKSSWRFRKDKDKSPFINEGLWAVSRHPNYLGEIVLWFGIFLCCFHPHVPHGGFAAWPWPADQLLRVAILPISPLFVLWLLSQVAPRMAEASANRRWADNPGYKAYMARVPKILPGIPGLS